MDSELVSLLESSAISNDKKIRVRKNLYPLFCDSSIVVTSWKYMDWAYYRDDLPIYARGLFTKDDQIIVRGYNKFFNIDEVPDTKWQSLQSATSGPYDCTVKENGCIVFISGYNGNLVVTSKHSTGPRTDFNKNHAEKSAQWVEKHLKTVGKTESDLANYLQENNWTAVGELCDDEFEEHVLAYEPKDAGIYITGLNHNTREFKTEPFNKIQDFAKEYGFIVTQHHVCETIGELQQFVEKCAETGGSWNGREIEGFVVRCKKNSRDFFFKYKFDEPYFMYRQWREVTKAYLKDPATIPRPHPRHAESCRQYLQFLSRYIPTRPGLADSVLNEGKGIIELRNKFLETTSMDEQELLALGLNDLPVKYILATVATIGCGKTVVANALATLTGWGHVQNDDVPGNKSKKAQFVKKAVEQLQQSPVVIFDRNNHQLREREQMFDDLSHAVAGKGYTLKFVCLNFLPNGPQTREWKVTRDRVVKRGNNHQTIRDMSPQQVTSIMKGFSDRFQPVNPSKKPDSEFDSIINLQVVDDGSRANVQCVLDHMKSKYGFDTFNSSDIDAAVQAAIDLKIVDIPVRAKAQKQYVQYFGVNLDGQQVLDAIPLELPGYIPLAEFHVTLAHKRSHRDEFKNLVRQFEKQLKEPYHGHEFVDLGAAPITVTAKHFCHNSRVAAFSVELDSFMSANEHPHVTTAVIKGARPVESNAMLKEDHDAIPVSAKFTGRLCAYF